MRLKTLLYTLCLRRYRAVSFDIFDTLLERDVDRPVAVFLRVGDIVLGAGKGEERGCAACGWPSHMEPGL